MIHAEESVEDKSIYHKNLMPVTYLTGDIAGAMERHIVDAEHIDLSVLQAPEEVSGGEKEGEGTMEYRTMTSLPLPASTSGSASV